MSRDRNMETKSRIKQAALNEFLLKGLNKASLRKIAHDAGVTTGAIYFSFDNKEDLFLDLIKPVIQKIKDVVKYHLNKDIAYLGEMSDFEMDLKASKEIIDIMYDYPLEVELIYQNQNHEYIHEAFEEYIRETELFINDMFPNIVGYDNRGFFHWFSHLECEIFVYVFKHCKTRHEAYKEIQWMVQFIRGGFYSLIS